MKHITASITRTPGENKLIAITLIDKVVLLHARPHPLFTGAHSSRSPTLAAHSQKHTTILQAVLVVELEVAVAVVVVTPMGAQSTTTRWHRCR
jgi:hypothetical protein